MKSVKEKEACLNGSSCPERDKRPRHTYESFGLKREDNDAMKDVDIRAHDIDDARK